MKEPAPALRVLRALAIAGAVGVVLWLGLRMLRDPTLFADLDPTLSKLAQALVAIVLGVGGIWALFYAANTIVEALPSRLARFFRPYVFVLPAVAVVGLQSRPNRQETPVSCPGHCLNRRWLCHATC